MKIMANHSSATALEETPHTTISNRLNELARRENESEKIEALTEMICGADEEAAAALLVLVGTIENSRHPRALANTVKHLAFTHCGELNVYGMVDAQIAVLAGELFR
jgi:L-asparaginase II